MEGVKILIINAEVEERNFLSYTLKNEGYVVYTVSDGKTAVAKAKEISPNCIILDVELPGLDGIEICKELKASPECSGASVMFISSRAEDYTQIAAFDAGADEYILKPIRPRVLVSRVKALLRRTLQDRKDATVMNGLTIDRYTHTVKIGKNEINLSKKEFDLLLLLISKPGKVYTREAIHKMVWEGDLEISDRIIDVHIWKLRQKLGKERIKTLKGIGYKIEA